MKRRRRECCGCCVCSEAHQVTRDGPFCRSLHVRACSRGCACSCVQNCGGACGCQDYCQGCQSCGGTAETVCRCTRFVDVPMKTVLGPDAGAADCCITQNAILREIADTLRSCRCCR